MLDARDHGRRRTMVGVGAVVVGAVALSSCGGAADEPDASGSASDTVSASVSGSPSGPEAPAGAPAGTLSLDLPDGSTQRFDDLIVTCDPADLPFSDGAADEGERIYVIGGPWDEVVSDPDVAAPSTPLLLLDVDVEAAQDELELPLPSDEETATLFAVADTGGPRANEVSSTVTDSSGTVTVSGASCDGEPTLELEVDAVLGSEVNQQPLRLSGSLG